METLRCPYAYFREARARTPVLRFEERLPTGAAIYLVTGHAAVVHVLSHPLQFTADLTGVLPGFDKAIRPPPFPDQPMFHEPHVVFFAGGEDHKIKRQWAMPLVRRSRLEACREAVRAEVTRLIDGFVADGRCDFQQQFSDLLPIKVLEIVLRLPPRAEPIIKRLSRAIAEMDVDPNLTPEQLADKEEAFQGLFRFNRELLEERARNPGDDYVSELVKLQVERDGTLDVNTLSIQLQGIMFGGDHAVGAHLSHLVLGLAQDPALQERLRADRSLVSTYIYETLRLETPVPWLFRHCVEDTSIGDVPVEKGSVVIAATAAANRDPARFPDPDTVSPTRANAARDHLAMGRGAHRCVGEPLAQLVAESVVNGLLDRMADIRLDLAKSDPSARPSHQFRCPVSVHLTFRSV